jgi:subtilisin family serine protease
MFTRTLVGVAAALLCAPFAATAARTPASPAPTHVRQMHWYHWHPFANAKDTRESRYGRRAVVGLEFMGDLAALRAQYALTHVRALPQLRAASVTVDRRGLRHLLAVGPTDARIRYIQPDGPARRPLAMPNDPLLSTVDTASALPYEWQFAAAHVDRALDYTHGSPSVVVGTIDTGLGDVPDLAGKVDGRYDIATDGTLAAVATPEANDDAGHGTAVASLIAANVGDGFGMAGFGGDSHIVAVRADDHGFSDAAVAAALMKLDSLGVRIVNLSIGGTQPDGPVLLDAIHKSAADGMLLVAAAGNDRDYVGYPAADLQPTGGTRGYGLAVGASDLTGNLASFSNSGRHLSLLAPGSYSGPCSGVLVAITPVSELDQTCYPMWAGAGGARYAYLAGTSFAAPEVAGIAALIWAVRPGLKNYQVADIIKASAARKAPGWTPTAGCGLLEAGAALALATSRPASAWDTLAGPASTVCSAGGSQPAAWPDRNPAPVIQALPDVGGWDETLSLRFRVGEDTHEIAPAITVRRSGRAVAHRSSGFFTVKPGAAYGLAWHAPRTPARGDYSFCVVARTRMGKRSAPSCAPISLR